MHRKPRLDAPIPKLPYSHHITLNLEVKDNPLGMSQKCSKMSRDWIDGSYTLCFIDDVGRA
jgi:hypothetical protein